MASLKCPRCGANTISVKASQPDPKANKELKDVGRKALAYFVLRTLAAALLGILALDYFNWRWELRFQAALLNLGWLHTAVNIWYVQVGIVVVVGLIFWFVPAPIPHLIRYFKIKRARWLDYHCLGCGHEWRA